MTRKRLFQIVGILIAAVWLASGIFAVGVLRAKKDRPQTTLPPLSTESTTAPTATAPTMPTTTAPTVTAGGNTGYTGYSVPTTTAPTTTAPTVPTTAGAAAVPSGKAAIVAAYVNAVNTLKATADFTLVKTETLNVVVDDVQPAAVRTMTNKIIEGNRKSAPESYVFSGGTDASSGLSPNNVIAPIGRMASLNESAVLSASATATAGGGYTMHLTFGQDTQTLNSPAANYSGVFQTISKDSLGLPSAAQVDDFTVIYDDSSIDATVDRNGRLLTMTHHVTVVSSEGHGSLVMAVTTKMHGDHTSIYDISY